MPALYPTFNVARYYNNTATLGPAGDLAEQYECSAGSKYGYYDPDGFIFNARMAPDPFQWGLLEYTLPSDSVLASDYGPRTIICMRDIGTVNSIRLYVRSDMVGRNLETPYAAGIEGTCYGSADTLAALQNEGMDSIAVALFEPRIPSTGLFLGSDVDETQRAFGLARFYNEAVVATPDTPVYGEIIEYAIPIAGSFPSRGLGIWVGWTNISQFWRQTICGVRINGVLYGVNENGETEEFTDPVPDAYGGPFWWQDLVNAEQSSVLPASFLLPFANPEGSYEDGYRYGYNELSQVIEYEGAYDTSSTRQELRELREPFQVGVYDGVDDILEDSPRPYVPTPSQAAERFARDFGGADARFDKVADSTYTNGQWYVVDAYAQGYNNPVIWSDGQAYGTEMIDRYNGFYNGYIDGLADSIANVIPGNPAPGQTGNANYNASYEQGYIEGYNDGPNQYD